MQIRMLVDALGADDGFTVRNYLKGQVYPQRGMPCGADLAQAFLNCEAAEPYVEEQPEAPAGDDGNGDAAPSAQNSAPDAGAASAATTPTPAPKGAQKAKSKG